MKWLALVLLPVAVFILGGEATLMISGRTDVRAELACQSKKVEALGFRFTGYSKAGFPVHAASVATMLKLYGGISLLLLLVVLAGMGMKGDLR